MKRTIELTSSMQRCFKSCRRRYLFEYVDCLKPASTPKALAFGTLYHQGLELLLGGNPLELTLATMLDCYRQECAETGAEDDGTGLVVAECLKAFDRDVPWRRWEIRALEKEFRVNCGYARYLRGKIDGIIAIDGMLFLLEHKTAATVNDAYLHHLLWDDQAGNYLYAARKLGLDVQGTVYIVCAKPGLKRALATAGDKLVYNKDGRLHARCRMTDETHAEYAARVGAWYAEQNRFTLQTVYRNPAELSAIRNDLLLTMDDIALCDRNGSFYRNPDSCRMLRCPYEALCLEDTPEVRAANFVCKSSVNEELEAEPAF